MLISGINLAVLGAGLVILPLLILRIFDTKPSQSRKRLAAAVVVYAITTAIASQFAYDNRLANFGQHFVGGGVATALIFVYMRQSLVRKLTPLQELTALFFLVSGTGVLNELLEFLLDQLTGRAYSTDRWDTWYDLLANSLGALTGWLIWKVYTRLRTMK